MSNSLLIAPSILSADPLHYGRDIELVEKSGADWLHIDIMDGSFVPPITFGADLVKRVRAISKLTLDSHLMIREPEKHVEAFAKAGSDRITVHQEATVHLHRVLGSIRSLGIKSGVAINPATPVEQVLDVLDVCDLVLIMTVNPGWGGQQFISSCLPKLEKLRDFATKNKLQIDIQVDGGINPETAKLCATAGANVFVAGSYVYGAADKAQAIRNLKV